MEDLGHAVEEPLLHHIPVRGIAIAAPDGHYPLPVWILLLRLQPRIPQAIEPGVTTPNGNLRTLSIYSIIRGNFECCIFWKE